MRIVHCPRLMLVGGERRPATRGRWCLVGGRQRASPTLTTLPARPPHSLPVHSNRAAVACDADSSRHGRAKDTPMMERRLWYPLLSTPIPCSSATVPELLQLSRVHPSNKPLTPLIADATEWTTVSGHIPNATAWGSAWPNMSGGTRGGESQGTEIDHRGVEGPVVLVRALLTGRR